MAGDRSRCAWSLANGAEDVELDCRFRAKVRWYACKFSKTTVGVNAPEGAALVDIPHPIC